MMPLAIFNKVDFPDPLRPTRHNLSRSDTDKPEPSNKGELPKERWMSRRSKIGGDIFLATSSGSKLQVFYIIL